MPNQSTTTPATPGPVEPAPPANVAEALQQAAVGPLSVSSDGQSVTGHNIKDLIELDKHNAAKAASRRRGLGIRMVKLIPPGAAGL